MSLYDIWGSNDDIEKRADLTKSRGTVNNSPQNVVRPNLKENGKIKRICYTFGSKQFRHFADVIFK